MKKNGFIQKITIKFYSPHGIIYSVRNGLNLTYKIRIFNLKYPTINFFLFEKVSTIIKQYDNTKGCYI
jgi:hypothetical protein